jgi:hypothetical protein
MIATSVLDGMDAGCGRQGTADRILNANRLTFKLTKRFHVAARCARPASARTAFNAGRGRAEFLLALRYTGGNNNRATGSRCTIDQFGG